MIIKKLTFYSTILCLIFVIPVQSSKWEDSYRKHSVKTVSNPKDKDDLHYKMGQAVGDGGDYELKGKQEKNVLLKNGLDTNNAFVIDVGCGSGRLAYQLKDYPGIKYIGTDLSTELLNYAKKKSNRPDWKFIKVSGTKIPAPDEQADFVIFFSVFTHIPHIEIYQYLKEAKRVLKKGGKVIASYLTFSSPENFHVWKALARNDKWQDEMYIELISEDALRAFAKDVGLTVQLIYDGFQKVLVMYK